MRKIPDYKLLRTNIIPSILLLYFQRKFMKELLMVALFLLTVLSLHAQKAHQSKSMMKMSKEITEQDYLEVLKLFEEDSEIPSEELKNAIGIAQMYLMRKQDNQAMIDFFELASEYAKRTGQLREYIDLKSNKAQLYTSIGKHHMAIDLIDSLISQYDIETSLLGRFHKAKGDAYSELKNFAESEKNYLKAQEIAASIQDTFHMGLAYISLALLHSEFGNVYDAIDYNIKGLNILEKGNHSYLVAGACNVLCTIFQELGNYDKAQEYAENMDLLCERNGYRLLAPFAKAALARQYQHQGDYPKAIHHYKMAIDSLEKKTNRIYQSNDKKTAFRAKIDLVSTYMLNNQYDRAKKLLDEMENTDITPYSNDRHIEYYKEVVKNALHYNNASLVRSTMQKVEQLVNEDPTFKIRKTHALLNKIIAEATGNYKDANAYQIQYFALKDSIEKEQRSQLVHNLEAKYQKAEQEKAISTLSFAKQKAESQIKQKNIVLALGGLGLAILSFLVFQFYKLYQNNKKNKEQLASQNITIKKALADKNILLKEIHHRVKNNLQVISSLLSLQSRYVKDADTLDAIKAGKSRVQSMSLLHQNLYRDDNLKGVEMNQYFQNLGQNLFDTYNIEENIKFTTDIDNITLDIDTVVPMGLITNELISNALKHAFNGKKEGSIHLTLKEVDNTLYLTVQDDGVGLPDAELPVSHKSLGATLIQSFAEKLEGDILIDTSEGSKVTIAIKDYSKVQMD